MNGYNNYQSNQLRMDKVLAVEDAKRYQMMPNSAVYLIDQSNPRIYLKTCDSAGQCNLRAFELNEISVEDINDTGFVTKKDFESFKSDLMSELKGLMKDKGSNKNA